jgi:hypothetical protein
MKLLEVAPDFMRSEAGVFMTILQLLQSKTKPGVKIPIANISKLMNNAGYAFSYDNIKELIEKNPALDDMISDYSKDFIVIGKESIANKEPDEKDAEKQASTVDKMAKSAAKNPTQPDVKPPQF